MRVLSIINSMDPKNGGPCQVVRNSIEEFTKLGNVHEVACLDNSNASFIQHDNFVTYTFGPTITPWRYSPTLLPWLKENLCNYDSIIIHGIWLYCSYATYKAIEYLEAQNDVKKIPKIFVMTHGMLDPYFQKSEERKWKAIRNSLYWTFFESKVIERAEAVLFTTEEEKQLATTTFKRYNPKNTINVGYGIQPPPTLEIEELNKFYDTFPQLKNKNYLLYISRIHPKKGLDLLLNAYIRLLNHLKYENIPYLFIVGPGWESPFGHLIKNQINANEQLKSKIVISDMLLGNIKWAAFYNSNGFILPSHQENFGIVVAEALACQKIPLITNKVNIYKDILEKEAGIASEDNERGVFDMLLKFTTMSSTDQKTMSKNAYDAYNELFTVKAWVNRLYKTIEK